MSKEPCAGVGPHASTRQLENPMPFVTCFYCHAEVINGVCTNLDCPCSRTGTG